MDKQHAVINYNLATDEHLVKDLGSLNGVRHTCTHTTSMNLSAIFVAKLTFNNRVDLNVLFLFVYMCVYVCFLMADLCE